jgi:hypothetical protein
VLTVSSAEGQRDFLLSASQGLICEDTLYANMTEWSERQHHEMVMSKVIFQVYVIVIQVRQAIYIIL